MFLRASLQFTTGGSSLGLPMGIKVVPLRVTALYFIQYRQLRSVRWPSSGYRCWRWEAIQYNQVSLIDATRLILYANLCRDIVNSRVFRRRSFRKQMAGQHILTHASQTWRRPWVKMTGLPGPLMTPLVYIGLYSTLMHKKNASWLFSKFFVWRLWKSP